MTRTMTLRFGPATIQIRAEKPHFGVLDALDRWLGGIKADDASTPDIRIEICGGRAPGRRDNAQAWSTDGCCGWWDGKAWDAVPHRENGAGLLVWRIFLHESPAIWATRFVPGFIVRWAHVHWFARDEILASAALYGHVLPAAQESLRLRNATLVHASAVTSMGGDAVLLLGRGGAGKTSASTQLYIRKPWNWRYMSDDLAVLSSEGILYRSPVPLNIFPYNTERFPELWALLVVRMSPWNRLQWRVRRAVFGASGAARRQSPFGDFLGPSEARVKEVVELARADIADPEIRGGEAENIVCEARDVLAHELRRGFDGMARLRKVAGAEVLPLPDPAAALDDAERVMRSAVRGARLHRILLPRLAAPDLVCHVVEQALGEKV